jgi:chitinase
MKSLFRNGKLLLFVLTFALIFTNIISFTTSAAKPDRVSPSSPLNLRSISITDTSVTLAWDPSTDNIGVTAYNIYQDKVSSIITLGKATTTTFSVSGLAPAKAYKFYVKAKDAAGNLSIKSSTLNVTTLQTIPAPTTVPKATKVVGYYAAWAAYSGYTPDKVDASKLTHINYAFANIGSDLKIALGYPDVDPSNINKLNTLKQVYPNLKTLISVGGWSWSGKFSDVALTEASRTAFADSCVDFIVNYGFNGIDIDWEYPVNGGLSTNVRRPEDKQNFTLLLKKLREKLTARSLVDGKQYLLTMAGASGSWYVNNTELNILHKYLDYGNIMTYDIHGTWDGYTDFNAPLYNNSDTSPQEKWSVDSSVSAWINTGFPAEKLIVGVPFYGYKYNTVNNVNSGLYQTFSGGSSISYSSIASNYLNTTGYVRYFHQQSMVPWLFNGSTFISYEDEQSIGLKAQYIKSKGLGGATIWELSQDPNKILLGALYKGLQ